MPLEYTARWSGARIGAGATVFHFQSNGVTTGAQALAAAVRALFEAQKSNLPSGVRIDFDTELRVLSPDGTLIGVAPVTGPLPVTGTNATAFANGTGFLIRHTTDAIIGGRRLLGRTFWVPAPVGNFTNTGDVLPATQTSMNTTWAAFRTDCQNIGNPFTVWSRKNATTSPVLTSTVLSRPTTLSTRNDRV